MSDDDGADGGRGGAARGLVAVLALVCLVAFGWGPVFSLPSLSDLKRIPPCGAVGRPAPCYVGAVPPYCRRP